MPVFELAVVLLFAGVPNESSGGVHRHSATTGKGAFT